MKIRSYGELTSLLSFSERFEYLSLRGVVGSATFGFDRHLNQKFYTSRQWRQMRQHVIARDAACDLGVLGYEIQHGLYIHHMNPIAAEDIVHGDEGILDPEFLITTTHRTHNAIHYGDASLLQREFKPRSPGDTRLW